MECVENENKNQSVPADCGDVELPKTEINTPNTVVGNNVQEQMAKKTRSERVKSEEPLEDILGVLGKYFYRQRIKFNRMHGIYSKKDEKKRHGIKKKNGMKVTDGLDQISKRNSKKLSIYPFVNFIREYRKIVPRECPKKAVEMRANRLWTLMSKEDKLPYIMRAECALQYGYRE